LKTEQSEAKFEIAIKCQNI